VARAARRDLSVDDLDHRPIFPRGPRDDTAPDTEVIDSRAFLRDTQSLPQSRDDETDVADEYLGDDADEEYIEEDNPTDDHAEDLYDGPAPRRGRRRLIAVLVSLVVVLGAGAWWWVAGPGAYTTTPSVDGLPAADAVAKIESMQLDATQEPVFDDAVAAGFVVGTEPGGTERVRREGTVVVLVSKGPQLFGVPLVTGSTREAAQTELAEANLALGKVTEGYHDTVKTGLVISSDPAAGERMRRGTPVAVVVSKGPQPVAVPTLVDQTQKDAEAALTTLRLEASVTTEISEKVEKGKVISQTPATGTLLPGETVALVVSSGPPLVEVPSVFRMSYSEAKRVLERAGFTVDRQGTRIFDQVFETRPSRGSMAPKGSTIIVRTF
jgi:serine/threonine-protein kinase